jgi:hypothetical protein
MVIGECMLLHLSPVACWPQISWAAGQWVGLQGFGGLQLPYPPSMLVAARTSMWLPRQALCGALGDVHLSDAAVDTRCAPRTACKGRHLGMGV